MAKKLRIVLDTQIFLRALVNDQSASARINPSRWLNRYTLYITNEIEQEYRDVLYRPKLRAKFPQITDDVVDALLKVITEEGERVEPAIVGSVSRDPKDDKFLACAKAAQADYLVSEDNDLLVLKQYEGTQIVNVLAFLAVLESQPSA